MSNLWFVYKSDNYEGIQFDEEVYTHYEEADKKRIKKLKTFINAQIHDGNAFNVEKYEGDYDAYIVGVIDGNGNYDDYDFVVTKLKTIDDTDKQKEEAIK